MNSKDLENFKNHLEQVQFFSNKIETISIEIEKRDSNYVYLIHTTSLEPSDVDDVYKNGLSYSGNELWRVFHNLSRDWMGKNPFREKADETSMEQVVVETCKKMSFQCFVYKIPLCFFEKTGDSYYPIPIWVIDKNYKYKGNHSSTGIPYGINSSCFFRIYPSLLLGHYDLRMNQFYPNENYSSVFENTNGIYDKQQLFFLRNDKKYQNLWQHNQCVLQELASPYSPLIEEITKNYQVKCQEEKIQK